MEIHSKHPTALNVQWTCFLNGLEAIPLWAFSTTRPANTKKPAKSSLASKAASPPAVLTPVASNKLSPTRHKFPPRLHNRCPRPPASNSCRSLFLSRTALYEVQDVPRVEILALLRFARCSVLTVLFETTRRTSSSKKRRPHPRKIHRHPQTSRHHFLAGLHANRGKVLFGDHGHRRRLARLRSGRPHGSLLRPVRAHRSLPARPPHAFRALSQ